MVVCIHNFYCTIKFTVHCIINYNCSFYIHLRGRFCLFLRLVFLVGFGRMRRYKNTCNQRYVLSFKKSYLFSKSTIQNLQIIIKKHCNVPTAWKHTYHTQCKRVTLISQCSYSNHFKPFGWLTNIQIGSYGATYN